MKTDHTKAFFRDLKKISNPTTKAEIEQVLLAVQNAQTKKDIPELKKLKGSKRGIFYRIKIGDYRIGITINSDIVTFIIFMHRKDFYKFFP